MRSEVETNPNPESVTTKMLSTCRAAKTKESKLGVVDIFSK